MLGESSAASFAAQKNEQDSPMTRKSFGSSRHSRDFLISSKGSRPFHSRSFVCSSWHVAQRKQCRSSNKMICRCSASHTMNLLDPWPCALYLPPSCILFHLSSVVSPFTPCLSHYPSTAAPSKECKRRRRKGRTGQVVAYNSDTRWWQM